MEEQETEKLKTENWSCSLCTFKNLTAQLKCQLCGTSRYRNQEGAEAEAIKVQADLLSRQWACTVCTFENIQSAKKCVKCDTEKDGAPARPNPQPNLTVKTTLRCDSPKIESSSCSTLPQLITKANDVVSYHDNDGDLIATSSTYKWKCQYCTYLNYAAAINCTMCRSPSHLSSKAGLGSRISEEFYKTSTEPVEPIIAENRPFMIVGSLSRYMYFTGQSHHEDLFFRAVGSIISKHSNAINAVVNYLINDGNVLRALNHFEASIVYDYAVNDVPVMCGDTLATLARRCGLVEVQKLLERVLLPEDNLPCATAAPTSELYSRIYHIFHFCRPPYKIPFRAYNFNIFKLPFPKTDLTTHLMNEILQSKFDPLLKQSLVRYVQIASNVGQDIRYSTVLSCPTTLVIRNRGGQHSLFDALLQSMFGVCDRLNVLRDQLHDHLNSHAEWYKPCFIRQYRITAAQLGIQLTDFDLEDLWVACVSGTSKQNYPPESIHIFALSHMIARPIIILPFSMPIELSKRPRNLLSLANSRSNPYHFLEGFYVPYFSKNEFFTRSPICLIHNNGQFYNWLTNDEAGENCQNFIIVNYPRNHLTQMFRFLDDCDEKQLRGFLHLVNLTPGSVAIYHANQEDCIPEATSFYFDYLNAAERALKINSNMKTVDVLRQMLSVNPPSSPNIIKLFNHRAKRLLSRRPTNYDSVDNLDDNNVLEFDETATKMPKVQSELKK